MSQADPQLTDGAPRVRLLRAPLAGPAMALAAGVLAESLVPVAPGLWVVIGLAGLCAALVGWSRRRLRIVATIGLLAAFFGVGAVRMLLVDHSIPDDHIVRAVDDRVMLVGLRGRVASQPVLVRPEVEFGYQPQPFLSFLLETDAARTADGWLDQTGLVQVRLEEPYHWPEPGDRVEIDAEVGRYRPPSNPGQFDRSVAAARRGVWVWASVPDEGGLRVLERPDAGPVRWFWRLRALARQQLADAPAAEGGQIVAALVLGERDPSLARLGRTMVRAGIAHYLSISGLHVGIFLGFVYLLCRIAAFTPRRSAIVVLVVLGAYLLVAEPRPALLRSAIMAALLSLGVLTGRRGSSLNALAAAALLLLLIDPRQLLAAGFQMSFGIVLGIVLFTPPLRRVLARRLHPHRGLMVYRDAGSWRRRLWHRTVDWTASGLAMAIVAWLVSAPLAALHFGVLSPYGAALSLAVFPLVVAILVPGYLALGLSWLTPNLAAGIGGLAVGPADALAWVVERLEYLPGLAVELQPVGWAWVAAWYAVLALAFWPGLRAQFRWPGLAVAAAVFAGLTITTQRPAAPPAGAVELHMLAVGNGQAVVLQAPDGRTILLDAGTRNGFDPWRTTIEPFLRERRLRTPDLAILSHANSDHYSALTRLVETGALETVLTSPLFWRTAGQERSPIGRLRDQLADAGVAVEDLDPGQCLDLGGGLRVTALWPPPDRTGLNPNDSSLVLRVEFAGRRVLLPGDLDETAQRDLLADPESLRADVLVMPHHGGWETTLPAFVAAVDPGIALVSATRGLHAPASAGPAAETFYRDLPQQRRIYSTARNGYIRVRLAADGIDIETMR